MTFRTTFGPTMMLWLALLAPPAAAADAQPAKLSDKQRADVARIERYLNDIKTLEARFLQLSSNGGFAEGRVYLSRPGKMRFEYDPPTPILIVSSGLVVTYYDRELDEVSETLLQTTPVAFLVRDKITLSGDVTVTKFARARGLIRVTVTETDSPDNGSITLVFTDRPLALRQWVVTDPQDVRTTVTLVNTRTGMHLDGKLFHFERPKRDDDIQ